MGTPSRLRKLLWLGGVSKLAWIAPSSAPVGTKAIELIVPDQFELEAAIRGALLPLFFSSNWEALAGGISIDDAIDYLNETVYQSLVNWTECTGGSKMVGEVFAYAGQGVPSGCLLCDGTEYSQSVYIALYNVIGDAWGSASSGNFCVPNISARGIISEGQISGGTLRVAGDIGGSESGTISVSNMPKHDHSITAATVLVAQGANPNMSLYRATGTLTTSGTGDGTPLPIMHPFIVIPYYIVAE